MASREFPFIPSESTLICQENAWMDKIVMLKWIDEVLVPYLQESRVGVVPVQLLDNYKVHKMVSVEDKLREIGVEAYFIPGRCTSVAQTVDIGVGKPFKDRLRANWMDWAIELSKEIIDFLPQSHEQVIEWIDTSSAEISRENIRNSWLKGGISYFPWIE